jgi:hypothetical protein
VCTTMHHNRYRFRPHANPLRRCFSGTNRPIRAWAAEVPHLEPMASGAAREPVAERIQPVMSNGWHEQVARAPPPVGEEGADETLEDQHARDHLRDRTFADNNWKVPKPPQQRDEDRRPKAVALAGWWTCESIEPRNSTSSTM